MVNSSRQTKWTQHLPRYSRNLLLIAVLLTAGLLVSKDHEQNSLNPLQLKSANAEIISAAPGFLTLSVPQGGGNFYLIDSTRQVICVYQLDGEKVRLVSARSFDRDTDIMDSSMTIRGPDNRPIDIEGGNGVTAQEAADFADGQKKALEEWEQRNRKK